MAGVGVHVMVGVPEQAVVVRRLVPVGVVDVDVDDVGGQLVHVPKPARSRRCGGTDRRSRRSGRTGCCNATPAASDPCGRRPRGRRRCRRSAASRIRRSPRACGRMCPRPRSPHRPGRGRRRWDRPRGASGRGRRRSQQYQLGIGARRRAVRGTTPAACSAAPFSSAPNRHGERVRLLLAALEFVNVGVLAREQAQYQGVCGRLDRLGEVLPEPWHGHAQRPVAARQAHGRCCPQAGPLACRRHAGDSRGKCWERRGGG